ncbi:MAG: cation:proton antiporter [Sulfuricurvum sp.]|jgi:Kef-type K+ transport system membrane component KefB|uniref:cation:proton antiporter domain-containing protein n=1 Tax=Sulfuricurvum sp. TaxID=2025608 RepID=UPI0025CD6A05|nr:cation:proton antiporter [Sulfuricurvum sp.]MCK9372872.1 cation:proton antiporter [Sulfuricurvum sp.]
MKKTLLIYMALILFFGIAIALILHYGTFLENPLFSEVIAPAASLPTTIGDTFLKQLHHPLPLLLIQFIVIMIVTRLFGYLVSFVAQPTVVGEILAGIILGPSLLGALFPDMFISLFPKESLGNLHLISQLGLIFFMFVVGMELDFDKIKKQSSASVFISHVSIIFPFFLGVALTYWLYPIFAPKNITFIPFALFIGIAMSITAFPVLARIIKEKNIGDTRYGSMAITCAAADDVTAWYILALIIAFSISGSIASSFILLLLIALYVIVMFYVIRPLLAKIGHSQSERLSMNGMSIIIVLLLLSSLATEAIGVHALFGAFMAGAMMPSSAVSRLKELIAPRLEYVSLLVLLPLFFALTGLRSEIGLLNSVDAWLICGGIIVIAVFGKLFGSALASKYMGFSWRDSFALGILMNTRGLMELVVLNIGYEMGILSTELFTMFVVMALATTIMTGPFLNLITRGFKENKVVETMQKSLIDLLSHELRTPLTLIRGAAGNLSNPQFTLAEKDKEEMVQTIVEGSRRMEKVIDNLLVNARFREGKTPLNKTMLRVDDVVSSALSIAENDWKRQAKLSFSPDVPPLNADIALLHLAIGNLLDNAFKYGDEVSVEITSAFNEITLLICNNGDLPSADTITTLGNLPGRLDNSEGKPGSGIGLRLSKKIIEVHGGTLTITLENDRFCAHVTLRSES